LAVESEEKKDKKKKKKKGKGKDGDEGDDKKPIHLNRSVAFVWSDFTRSTPAPSVGGIDAEINNTLINLALWFLGFAKESVSTGKSLKISNLFPFLSSHWFPLCLSRQGA